jgi:phosphoglycolate phosphatase
MTVSGILFDKDGTLFDFQKTWGKWAKIFLKHISKNDTEKAIKLGRRIGYNYTTEEFLSDSIVIAGTPNDIAINIISSLPKWNITELTDYMNEVAKSAEIMAAVPLKPLLLKLRSEQLKLGVATNDGSVPAIAHLKSAEIFDFFDFIVGSDSGYGFKPNPGMQIEFCKRFQLKPETVLMVGDSTHDLIAGRSANMICVGVLTGIAEESELIRYADVILNDIAEIPKFLSEKRLLEDNSYKL